MQTILFSVTSKEQLPALKVKQDTLISKWRAEGFNVTMPSARSLNSGMVLPTVDLTKGVHTMFMVLVHHQRGALYLVGRMLRAGTPVVLYEASTRRTCHLVCKEGHLRCADCGSDDYWVSGEHFRKGILLPTCLISRFGIYKISTTHSSPFSDMEYPDVDYTTGPALAIVACGPYLGPGSDHSMEEMISDIYPAGRHFYYSWDEMRLKEFSPWHLEAFSVLSAEGRIL